MHENVRVNVEIRGIGVSKESDTSRVHPRGRMQCCCPRRQAT